MKNLIVALALLTFLASPPSAMARGNSFVLDHEWKKVEEQRKQQDMKFKAIEAEAKALSGEANTCKHLEKGKLQ